MKEILILLLNMLVLVSIQAQNPLNPPRTLKIQKENQTYLSLEMPNVGMYKNAFDWDALLLDFQNNLESVQGDIPDYFIYKISYIKGRSLLVEEVDDVVKYQVSGDQSSIAARQSSATLKDGEFLITLYFSSIEDLFAPEYKEMLNAGIKAFDAKLKWLGRQYIYSYEEEKIKKGTGLEPVKKRLVAIVSPSIGIYKNQAIYELGTGFGSTFGIDGENLAYFFISHTYQYREELVAADRLSLLYGAAVKFSFVGIQLAFPVGAGPLSNDFHLRYSATFYPTNNLNITTHFFLPKDSGTIMGFSFGYGF